MSSSLSTHAMLLWSSGTMARSWDKTKQPQVRTWADIQTFYLDSFLKLWTMFLHKITFQKKRFLWRECVEIYKRELINLDRGLGVGMCVCVCLHLCICVCVSVGVCVWVSINVMYCITAIQIQGKFSSKNYPWPNPFQIQPSVTQPVSTILCLTPSCRQLQKEKVRTTLNCVYDQWHLKTESRSD